MATDRLSLLMLVVVGVAQDMTNDRKHAQALREMQYLKASQKAKVETERNMTACIAHELRNPLCEIDSDLATMPDYLPESAKIFVSAMQLCSSFLSTIMDNLLDVRKMEEGKMTPHVAPISLQRLVNSFHRMLLPSTRPGVKFTKSVNTRGRDWVLGDEHRLQQVLTNVVTNAIKYTLSGFIELIVDWRDDEIRFDCIDTGPGIPKGENNNNNALIY
jgi:signal transduction histidine kinase